MDEMEYVSSWVSPKLWDFVIILVSFFLENPGDDFSMTAREGCVWSWISSGHVGEVDEEPIPQKRHGILVLLMYVQ